MSAAQPALFGGAAPLDQCRALGEAWRAHGSWDSWHGERTLAAVARGLPALDALATEWAASLEGHAVWGIALRYALDGDRDALASVLPTAEKEGVIL